MLSLSQFTNYKEQVGQTGIIGVSPINNTDSNLNTMCLNSRNKFSNTNITK